jgi:hypothetical protein
MNFDKLHNLHVPNFIKLFFKKYVPDLKYKRFGSVNDGGYILADDLSSNDFLISFGIEANVDFEEDLAKTVSGIHAYDYSIDEIPRDVDNLLFFKEKIGSDAMLSDILQRCPDNKDLILKADIEGGEFDFLSSTTEQELARFRQIIIEFHWVHDYFYDGNSDYREKLDLSMTNLLKTHDVVWIHGNNNAPYDIYENTPVPSVFEALFLRKSSYNISEYPDPFKGLNAPNDPYRPEIVLSFG